MLHTTTTEMFLAIPGPSHEIFDQEDTSFRESLNATLDELAELKTTVASPDGEGECDLSAALLEDAKKPKTLTNHFSYKARQNDWEACHILQVSCRYDFSIFESAYDADRWQDEQEFFFTASAGQATSKIVTDLVVLANLARAGSLEVHRSAAFTHDRPTYEVPRINCMSIHLALAAARKWNWPPIRQLPLEKVVAWFQSSRKKIDGFDSAPVDRAICAFARLTDPEIDDFSPMLMLWALVGVEALYVSDRSEILSQVRKKSEAFLGAPAAYKKLLSRMYNFRSRFVHGDLGFPSIDRFDDNSRERNRYEAELEESTAMAICLLTATLQEIVYRDWDGVDFSIQPKNAGLC